MKYDENFFFQKGHRLWKKFTRIHNWEYWLKIKNIIYRNPIKLCI